MRQAKNRLDWYRAAAKNLGLASLIRLQVEKRLAKDLRCLTSKYLAHPVFARRGTSDMAVFHQIFVEREYSCLDHIRNPPLIVDCGANVGYSSAYFLTRFPGCKVIAIEPDPDNFKLLKRNVEPYGYRCRCIQAAIWPSSEALRFKDPPKFGEEWGRTVEAGTSDAASLSTLTIPAILQMTGGRISILKIDIEGAELHLFSADTSWLENVESIVIELHDAACEAAFLGSVRKRTFSRMFKSGELTCCSST